jgi:hypothetical protein
MELKGVALAILVIAIVLTKRFSYLMAAGFLVSFSIYAYVAEVKDDD